MPRAQKPAEVKPGKLMSGVSAESIGIGNYSVKQDFRRVLERDIRAEGYEWYRPNPLYDKLLQSIPTGSATPITMLSECALGNGRIALVAGNPTTLWRYIGLEDPNYYDTEGGLTYYDTEGGLTYYDDGQAGWEVIGSGFSSAGNRWEAVQVGEYLVLNNGLDLPMTYSLQEDSVKPIYELREQQIAYVHTIAMQDGCLCCMGTSQINDTAFLSIMTPVVSSLPASQNSQGLVQPAAALIFPTLTPAQLTGLTLFWSNGQVSQVAYVDAFGYIHSTQTYIPEKDALGRAPYAPGWTPTFAYTTISSQSLSVENPAAYALFNDQNNIQTIGFRFFPSMPSNPRRFGATVPISFNVGSRIGTLLYPVRSIPELVNNGIQTSFQITGIGPGSTNITANVIFCNYGITQTVLIDQTAQTQQPFGTTAEFQDQLQSSLALIEAADAAQSFAGVFEDLEDDGSPIIKALTLQGQLVIYKATPVIFLASYTGNLTTPFQFQRVPIQGEGTSLYHRNTLIAGGGGYFGSYHLYAAKNGFYKFTLFTGVPIEEPTLQPCSNIFFQNASDNENTFAVENPLTREIFFVFPVTNGSQDNAICLDYAYNTARTTTAPIAAACRARRPTPGDNVLPTLGPAASLSDYWFVIGQSDGSIKRYGIFTGALQSSSAITGTLAAGTVTASAAFFNPSHVGMTLIFSGGSTPVWVPGQCPAEGAGIGADGIAVAIAEYISPTQVTVYTDATLPAPSLSTPQTFILNPAIWHRDGSAYSSTIQSGLDAMGLTHGEKQINEYVLTTSSESPDTQLSVGFLSGVNPAVGKVMQTGVIKHPNYQNLIKPTLLAYYLGLNVGVAGMNNPVEITGHLINIIPVNSHSFGRRPIP